jgi:hypothetical protein
MRGIGLIRVLAALAVVAGLAAAPTANAEDVNICPSGMTGVATADTSCAFAENVRAAWYAQPPGAVVTAYSPVTQQTYTMQCAPTVMDSWPQAQRCSGVNSYGTSLVVFISTPSGTAGDGQAGTASEQPVLVAPSGGVGADSPDLPYVDAPGFDCTWVNSYTKSNGTSVSGHWRC